MDFLAKIKAFEEKANLAANTSVCKAFEYLGVNLVELTGNGSINIGGFSNGDIANNWHVSVGGLTMVMPNGPDMTGAASLSRIKGLAKELSFYKKDNTVFLTNVMNYSYRADKLGWPTEQSTNGWNWSGNVVAYGFVDKSLLNLKGKYM
jgi:hypothetical protein